MKKILSGILVLMVVLTLSASVAQNRSPSSAPLPTAQMSQAIGGKNIWLCVGGALIGGVGIAGTFFSFGTSDILAIYGLSLVATSGCAV